MSQRLDIGAFNRHEHQYKTRALHSFQRRIILGGKLIDMRAHGAQMRIQKRLPRRLFGGIDGLFIGHQRDLAVEHDFLAVGQQDDEIRVVGPTVLAAKQHLGIKMGALVQAGRLQRAFQLHLAPIAKSLFIALERTRQRLRIVGHFHAHIH